MANLTIRFRVPLLMTRFALAHHRQMANLVAVQGSIEIGMTNMAREFRLVQMSLMAELRAIRGDALAQRRR